MRQSYCVREYMIALEFSLFYSVLRVSKNLVILFLKTWPLV